MKSIAITGTIGSGKSACSQLLREAGFEVFDCDRACHQYLKQGGLLYERVVDLLGPGILKDSEIDRSKVADMIFTNPQIKKVYEQMFHDELRKQMKHLMENKELFIAEVPLLFETGFDEMFDEVWLVYCDEETAVMRCMKHRNMNEEDVRRRIRTQMNVDVKKEKSDVLLDNSGTLEDLKQQVMHRIKGRDAHGTAC